MLIKFITKTDARTFYENSVVYDWKWFEGFTHDKLIDFIYLHAHEHYAFHKLLSDFLKTYNQNPKDYGLTE
jgi:hypothetical protein